MRARTRVIATAAAGALVVTAGASMAGASTTGPHPGPATHRHGVGVEDMAPMHDDEHDAHPDMAAHMAAFGVDPDQMRDWTVQDHRHDDVVGMGHTRDGGWMHD